jgi:hypothetical protein
MYANPRLPSAAKISHPLGAFRMTHKDVFKPQFEFVFALREASLPCLQENEVVRKTEVTFEGLLSQAPDKYVFGRRNVAQTFMGLA